MPTNSNNGGDILLHCMNMTLNDGNENYVVGGAGMENSVNMDEIPSVILPHGCDESQNVPNNNNNNPENWDGKYESYE